MGVGGVIKATMVEVGGALALLLIDFPAVLMRVALTWAANHELVSNACRGFSVCVCRSGNVSLPLNAIFESDSCSTLQENWRHRLS